MKKLKLIIIFILVFLLTGCGDYRELTNMSIVSAMGLDKIDDNYELTVQILDSKLQPASETGAASPEIVVYSATGKTIHETLRNAILQAPKKLYIGHVETVIISEEAAYENVSAFFDFILRDSEASKDFNVLIAKDYSIKEIMDILTPIETIPAENLASSIENASMSEGSIINIPFDKFVANVLEKGIDAVSPIVTIINTNSYNEKIDPDKRLILGEGLAIFKDYKLLGYINKNSSIGYNLLKEGVSSNVISYKCSDKDYAAIELIDNKTDFTFDVNTNTIKINSKIDAALSELNCDMSLEEEKDVKYLEKLAKNKVEGIFNETLDDAKKYYESDFLGIGLYIYRNNYKYYKKNVNNIGNIIKNMKKDINVEVDIIQKGSIKEGDEKY